MAQNNFGPIEPPDLSILKDKTQLDFYLTALENWEELQEFGGYPANKRAAVIFTYAVKSYPALCKQMTDHFKKTLKDDNDGVKKIVDWLKTKFGLNKHADIVRVLNKFLNTTRNKNENLQDYITRFETAYNEVNNLGETFSPTARAVLLLRQAELSETDHQIITVNLNLDPKSEKATEHFDDIKNAMKRFQDTKTANSSCRAASQQSSRTYLGEFMDSLEKDDTVDDETKHNIQAFIAQQRGSYPRGGKVARGRGGRALKGDRVWKCDFCLCNHKKWESCSCPCTTHSRDKCPNPDPDKVKKFKERQTEFHKRKDAGNEGAENKKAKPSEPAERGFYGYMKKLDDVFGNSNREMTLVAKIINVRENANPQPLDNLMEILGVIKPSPAEHPQYDEAHRASLVLPGSAGVQPEVCLSRSVSIFTNRDQFHDKTDEREATRSTEINQQERIFIGNQEERTEQGEDSALNLLLDTGSPSTICGVAEFKKIKEQYPPMIQATFRYEESSKVYEFGGGETTPSLGRVRLPMYLVDTDGDIQVLMITVEILQQKDVPFLLGGRSMRKTAAVIDLAKLTITLTWQDKTMEFGLHHHSSGHFLLKFFPLSDRDERMKVEEYLDKEKWTDSLSNTTINYLINKESSVADIITQSEQQMERILISRHRKGDKKPLNQKEVNKLHHVFGHAHPDKLKQIIKKSGKYNEITLEAIEKLRSCEVCQVENSRLPRPRIALPRSSAFGHVVCMDLKENKRFKNAPPYIFYMVDTHTRFKAAVFIKDKKTETVAEAFVLEWVKFHGPPKYIMADRGSEFMGGAMRDLCQFHGIRFTSTASHSPHQNAKAERGHAVMDRALERMITAQPGIKPTIALAWVTQAANTLQNVDGFCPFMLVFGRVPQHPTLVEINPGDSEEIVNSQARWVNQYKVMMAAREAFVAAESDKILRKGLEQRIYSDHSTIHQGDWIYFKRNCDRSWQGPAKLVLRDGKRLHLVRHGQPIVVNADDVLMNKPAMEESGLEDFVRLPAKSQPPSHPAGHPQYGETLSQAQLGPAGSPVQVGDLLQQQNPFKPVSFHDTSPNDANEPAASSPESEPQQEQDQNNDVTQDQNTERPANSTNNPAEVRDLGQPMMCNLCQREVSSLNIRQHIQDKHQIVQPNLRTLATMMDRKPDSLYENIENLKPGVAMVDQQGDYVVLQEPTEEGWKVKSIVTGLEKELELIKDMTEMRYIGVLDSETEEGVNIVQDQKNKFISYDDYKSKVFFTAQEQYEPEVAYVVNIPRSRHGEPKCVAAKEKELNDFSNYDVYEVVDRPKKGTNIINTQWVLVEKDKADGTTVTKARLCIEGNLEQNRHLIPVDSPTVNPISVRIIATIGASLGYDFQTADVQRAFLQSDSITRDVFVKPPPEMGLPRDKVWKLKRTAYGLVDASRAFFLKQAKELTNLNFRPSKLDPALFIHKKEGEEMFDIATAVHVDDSLNVGNKKDIDKAQSVLAEKFTYGTVETLPFRFLGQNYKRDEHGDLSIDTNHYVEKLELPEIKNYAHLVKQDVLPDDLQSVFRSLASKLNTISRTVRPDYSYQAKYLTTRYGKATKSDLTQAVKLLRQAREETTEVAIPNIGEPEDWLLVGVADASHRKGAEMMAVGGHVVILMNKNTHAASVLHWSSKKIDRICHSSTAAETIALQKMFSSLYFTRQLLEELCGSRVSQLQCLTMTDNQALFSNVHHLKGNTDDYRLQTEVLAIRQSIEVDKIAQELRYCLSEENIADCLTKISRTSHLLMNVIKTGVFNPPDGTTVRDSTMNAVRTWGQLMQAEAQVKTTNKSSDK